MKETPHAFWYFTPRAKAATMPHSGAAVLEEGARPGLFRGGVPLPGLFRHGFLDQKDRNLVPDRVDHRAGGAFQAAVGVISPQQGKRPPAFGAGQNGKKFAVHEERPWRGLRSALWDGLQRDP